MIGRYIGDWRWMAVRGVVAVLFGVATLAWPDITLVSLVLLWGAYALVDGLFTLGAALFGDIPKNRGWWGLCGLVGIAAGIVTFVWPSITALGLLYVIAFWALTVGIIQVVTAIRMRKEITDEWALGIAGILSVALGVFLLVNPGAGALAITWAIGLYALFFGTMEFILAWEVRRETHRTASTGQLGTQPGTPHPAT